MALDEIQYPPGFGLEHVIAWGSTGLVVLDAASQTVIKTPFDEQFLPHLQREGHIYERFAAHGGHRGLLKYHGPYPENGIRLEYAPNHDLQSFVQEHDVSQQLRLRWIVQAADALAFIHDAGVIHGDVTTANMFLDRGMNVRLADFAGSSIDSSPLLVAVTASHECPGNASSAQGDIFAFGSASYEIATGQRPYAALSEADIQAHYRERRFPDTASLGSLGRIITTCWTGGYHDSKALVTALRGKGQ
ncbi:hypothetical protein HIM_07392 [Hirsutella minnesotensis 3608]|uniref:EKC/KEOPS complex subunit BUD32 n=1 Tax=Hirsutella minnesotensis 3608 TaxID=1043627 RepID=A0A0F7ZN62_9HYPO|nr:hypothetical protein HIM_07392 [Hirsutella minnesotensis 3608]